MGGNFSSPLKPVLRWANSARRGQDFRSIRPLGATIPQIGADMAHRLMTCLGSLTAAEGETSATAHERDHAYHRLVQFLMGWAHTMKRRDVLRTFSWAATAASVGHSLNPDEQARLAAALSNPGGIDAQTIEHFEAALWRCTQQDDALARAASSIPCSPNVAFCVRYCRTARPLFGPGCSRR